jgi:hypothetical protein
MMGESKMIDLTFKKTKLWWFFILVWSLFFTVNALAQSPVPMLFIDNVETREDFGVVRFTISLTAISDHQISCDYSTVDGTATAYDDYYPTQGTITFDAGMSYTTIEISIINDTLAELREFFTITLQNLIGAVFRDPYGFAVIFDDDVISPVFLDEDDDGEADSTDLCPNTPSDTEVDGNGCSLYQYCSSIAVSSIHDKMVCRRSDWKNNEPLELLGDCHPTLEGCIPR